MRRIEAFRKEEFSRSCPGIETCVPVCMPIHIERAHQATLRGCTMSNPAGAKLSSSLSRTVSHRCCVKFACPRHPPSGRKAVLGLDSRTCVAISLVFPRSYWQRRPSCSSAPAFVHRFFWVVQSAETGMPSRAGTQKAQKCTGELNALASTTSLCVFFSMQNTDSYQSSSRMMSMSQH